MFRSPRDVSSESELVSESKSEKSSVAKLDGADVSEAHGPQRSAAPAQPLTAYRPSQEPTDHKAMLLAVLLEDYVATRVPLHGGNLEAIYEGFVQKLTDLGMASPEVLLAARGLFAARRAQYEPVIDKVLQMAIAEAPGVLEAPSGTEVARSGPSSPTRGGGMRRPGLSRSLTEELQAGPISRNSSMDFGLYRSSFQRSPSLISLQNANDPIPMLRKHGILKRSRYRADYIELGILGKGGFGKVYRVRAKLDKQEYACKMVVLRPDLFKSTPKNIERWSNVIREIEILAVLDHPNIVRYHNSWIEENDAYFIPAHNTESHPQKIFEEDEGDDSSLFERKKEDNGSFDICFEDSQAGSGSRLSTIGDSTASAIEHAHDQPSESLPKKEPPTKPRRSVAFDLHNLSISDTKTSSSPNAASASVADAESAFASLRSGSDHSGSDGSAALVRSGSSTPGPRDAVVTLHILMAVYPLTLKAFLDVESTPHRHCFCLESSLDLFLGICTGVAHLHQKNIVHRDLKPANVFLSYVQDVPADCCKGATTVVTPRIGDFGLVAEMRDSAVVMEEEPTTQTHVVGTELYRSPEGGTAANVDVWALAVLLVELLCPFTTRSERVITLSKLTATQLIPKEIKEKGGAELVELVLGCLQRDPQERWALDRVMRLVQKILAKAKARDDDDAIVYGGGGY